MSDKDIFRHIIYCRECITEVQTDDPNCPVCKGSGLICTEDAEKGSQYSVLFGHMATLGVTLTKKEIQGIVDLVLETEAKTPLETKMKRAIDRLPEL